MGERDLERLAREAEVMLDSRDALFLKREQDPLRRADGDRGVVTEMDSKCQGTLHGRVSIWLGCWVAGLLGG
jgi:hypothetical protein